MNLNLKKNAVISVSRKDGLESFASFLINNGYTIFGTTGTRSYLMEHNVECRSIEEITKSQEMLGGRVKTLSSYLMAGILSKERDSEELVARSILPIDLVYVEPYDFVNAFFNKSPDMVEFVDIGGITLLRAAAKNYSRVITLLGNSNTEQIRSEMRDGEISLETRKKLAAAAFRFTSLYDYSISEWFGYTDESFTLGGGKFVDLRYGENPHQTAYSYNFYRPFFELMREGKEVSYNNIIDAWSAWDLVNRLGEGSTVVVKHTSPCGASIEQNSLERAYESDPVSAYGGILAHKGTIKEVHASFLRKKFLELIIASDYDKDAYELLSQKKNLRILKGNNEIYSVPDIKTVGNVILVQKWNRKSELELEAKSGSLTPAIRSDLEFGWEVVKSVKSNAVAIVKDGWLLSSGGGQPNRVDSVKLAISKAKDSERDTVGALLISDGFFPFKDSVEFAHQNGINMVASPMGSIRDEEVINYSKENGITFIRINERGFRH